MGVDGGGAMGVDGGGVMGVDGGGAMGGRRGWKKIFGVLTCLCLVVRAKMRYSASRQELVGRQVASVHR